MTTIGDIEAAADFGGLLDRVARGEHVVITRNGQAIARLLPSSLAESSEADRAALIAKWRAARHGLRLNAPVRDLIAEGRR